MVVDNVIDSNIGKDETDNRDELEHCKQDPIYFISKYILIKNKDADDEIHFSDCQLDKIKQLLKYYEIN